MNDIRIGFSPSDNELPAFLKEHDINPVAALKPGVGRCSAVKYVYAGDPDAGEGSDDLLDILDEVVAARATVEVAPEDISLEAVLEAVQEDGHARLCAWWDARVVFPYAGQDETVRYLVARKTGQSDDVSGRYLRLANTKPWVADDVVFELISGYSTVEPGEDLILTEGITDAIRAHKAGFFCIPPVTKQFKEEHYDVGGLHPTRP